MIMKRLADSQFRAVWLAAICLAFPAARAQTISVPNNAISMTGKVIGQSFTATLTGTVTAISVQSDFLTSNATLLMYNGNTGSGLATIGTPAYQQTNVTLQALAKGQWQTITLTTPFPVVAGLPYTFVLDGGANFLSLLASTLFVSSYPNGVLMGTYGLPSAAGNDLAFQIFEAAAPAPVPSLSEWAVIVLAASLGLAGWAAVRWRSRV